MAAKKTTKKAAKPAARKSAAKPVKTSSRKAAAAPKASSSYAPRIGGWWGNSFSGAGVLIAVAAIIGIVGFFTAWLTADYSGIKVVYSGLELLTISADFRDVIFNNAWQTYIPIITLILSIIVLLAIILPALKVRANQYGIDALVILCGIVMFIMALCFMFGQMTDASTVMTGKFYEHLDVGFVLTMASSIIMILAGLRDATARY